MVPHQQRSPKAFCWLQQEIREGIGCIRRGEYKSGTVPAEGDEQKIPGWEMGETGCILSYIFAPGLNLFIILFMFILPMPPLIPLSAFCMA